MNAFAQAINNVSTTTRTENGDKAYTTSFNSNVDLFAKIAAIRGQGYAVSTAAFSAAYKEDPEIASRIALWARDVRGGAGERQVFKDILLHLEKTDTERLERLLPLVPEVGRWDDLFVFTTSRIQEQVLTMFAFALRDGNGLAAKWAPRENSKNKAFAKKLREFMNLSPRQYRKLVSGLTSVVESQMCAKEWEGINFSHVPSVASSRYSKAFWKRQPERYGEFVQKATKGEVKINASALFPYECFKSSVDQLTANALWNQLPDYVSEGVSFIPMVDVSGSMTARAGGTGETTCMDVAISLGMYLAERNKTAFNRLLMTFSSDPAWVKVPNIDSVREKYRKIQGSNWGMSTNLDAGMRLVLDTAIKNKVPASDMPQYLLIMSDMEFNGGYYSDKNTSVAERTKQAFEQAGYEMPQIVWWNIQSRNGTTPVRADEKGMLLVSGCSPAITKTVLTGKRVTPYEAMMEVISIERYDH